MQHPQITSQFIGDNLIYHIKHNKFEAKISRFGGHVLSFIPNGQSDVLWMSNSAVLDGSVAIRGGIPLCWPWFGAASGENAREPQHGYARILPWQFELESFDEQSVRLTATPIDTENKLAKFNLKLKLILVLDSHLNIQLQTTNISEKPVELSQAIHTYFDVNEIEPTQLFGLEGTDYLDKLQDNQQTQSGAISITEETDRVYLTNTPEVKLDSANHGVNIGGSGHDSMVVWNPWINKAKAMKDFDDLGYKHMICVEMANTQGLTVSAGDTVTLSQQISVL